MSNSIVFMGVAGCGKSTVAAAIAQVLDLPLIEGDDFHSENNRLKMSRGIPLNDDDRDHWLLTLCQELQKAPQGIVLTCSALKRKYRDRLRQASPGVRFVFLDLTCEEAQARVAARSAHFFSPDLVVSQFAALESPVDEVDVLRVNATKSPDSLVQQISEWVRVIEL